MALPPDAAEQVRALKTLERAILALGLTSYVQTTLYGCALK